MFCYQKLPIGTTAFDLINGSQNAATLSMPAVSGAGIAVKPYRSTYVTLGRTRPRSQLVFNITGFMDGDAHY
jgi:hypothetical protein